MGIVVQKYGGSSVADVDRLRGVARRIVDTWRAGHQVVAVVSAMGKTTDELLTLARQVSPEPGRRELDMLVSVGERISMTLLCMAVAELGVESISFTGSQSGIITDTSHFNARIVEVRPYRLIEALRQGRVVVVAGYQGVSLEKEVTTLGRGGTDTTAVALAAALQADYCEICSDVDGVYTGDPRIIEDASHIDSLGYDEMLALAGAGARVLAATAVAYAKRHGIVIHASSTFGDPQRFTRIEGVDPRPGPVAVTGDAGAVRLSWRGPREELGAALAWCAEMGLLPRGLRVEAEGPDRVMSLWLRSRETPDLGKVEQEGRARFGARFGIERHLGTVTLVGHQISDNPAFVAQAVAAVEALGVEVGEVSAEGSGLSLVVPQDAVTDAQVALHRLLQPR